MDEPLNLEIGGFSDSTSLKKYAIILLMRSVREDDGWDDG
jgi:hypothetical protein